MGVFDLDFAITVMIAACEERHRQTETRPDTTHYIHNDLLTGSLIYIYIYNCSNVSLQGLTVGAFMPSLTDHCRNTRHRTDPQQPGGHARGCGGQFRYTVSAEVE